MLTNISVIFTVLLGAACAAYLASFITYVTIDKILQLTKFGHLLLDYARHKGRCKDCRKERVYVPKIKSDN